MADLDDLLAMGEAHARRVLLELGQEELTAFYHLVTPPGREDAVLFTNWNGEAEKRAIMAAAREISRDIGAVAAMWLGEAWLATYDTPGPPPDAPMPSQHPNRREVVVVIATDGDETKARMLSMQRGEAGRIVALVDRHPGDSGLFFGRLLDGLIPPPKAKMN